MTSANSAPVWTPRFVVLLSLIALVVVCRLVGAFVPGITPPNFTPVESLALFGAAYFADRRLAVLLPLAAMALADLVIGLHGTLLVVYACIAATSLLGFGLRGRVSTLRVTAFSVVAALGFFLVTNFAVWLGSGMYPLDAQGLVACYVAALPFLKYTLAGTLFYSAVLFGGFELLSRRIPALRAQTV